MLKSTEIVLSVPEMDFCTDEIKERKCTNPICLIASLAENLSLL